MTTRKKNDNNNNNNNTINNNDTVYLKLVMSCETFWEYEVELPVDRKQFSRKYTNRTEREAFQKLSHFLCFQMKQHIEDKIINKGDFVLASVPFIFHIHDEPHDYFRFTKFGLKLLFKDFANVKIYERNGWLEAIFVIFIRLEKEKNILSRLLGKTFTIIAFLILPLILLIQFIIPSKKITTGYYVEAQK